MSCGLHACTLAGWYVLKYLTLGTKISNKSSSTTQAMHAPMRPRRCFGMGVLLYQHASACVSMRQHASAYVNIRLEASMHAAQAMHAAIRPHSGLIAAVAMWPHGCSSMPHRCVRMS